MLDEKPKNKAQPSRFNQNEGFLMLVLALLVLMLMQLDVLLGAVGAARKIAEMFSVIVCISTPLLIVTVLITGTFYNGFAWILIAFVLLCGGIPQFTYIVIPPQILPIMFVLTIIVWLLSYRRNFVLSTRRVHTWRLLVLAFCMAYWFSNLNISFRQYEQVTDLNTGSQHYVVLQGQDFQMNIHWLEVYKCNVFAFDCHEIYDSWNDGIETRGYDEPQYVIDLRHEDNAIRLYVDDELWFEQRVE